MLTDLTLAIAHHLLIFALAGVLVAEMMLVRPEMGPPTRSRSGVSTLPSVCSPG